MGESAGALAWTRGGIVTFAALAALIALNPPGDIVEITIFSGSLYAACFAPAVLSAYTGGVAAQRPRWPVAPWASRCCSFGWLWVGRRLHEVFPALAASALVYVTLALVTRPVEDSRVSAFFAPDGRQGAATGW